MVKKDTSISLQEASTQSTVLANLRARMHESHIRLQAITPILPAFLANGLRAASWEDGCWCILAPHAASANKLRQLLPKILTHLQTQGLSTKEIHIKVHKP